MLKLAEKIATYPPPQATSICLVLVGYINVALYFLVGWSRRWDSFAGAAAVLFGLAMWVAFPLATLFALVSVHLNWKVSGTLLLACFPFWYLVMAGMRL